VILVVSTCRYRLSEEEFVRPILEIVRGQGLNYTLKRYYEDLEFGGCDGVIICGTALMDFDYLSYVDRFRGLLGYKGGVLGICAGYQILARLFGCSLEPRPKIGVYTVRVVRDSPLARRGEFRAYFLHSYAATRGDGIEALAYEGGEICMFRVKDRDFYGVSFHPEVLNREVIIGFLKALR